jgi:hypothetical protein
MSRALSLVLLLTACQFDRAPSSEFSTSETRFTEMLESADYVEEEEEEGGYGRGRIGDRNKSAPMPPPSAVQARVADSAPPPPEPEPMASTEADKDTADADGAEAATRAWFPETFLFAPQVVTDDSGNASVTVTVPDRLTEWRILGLAHAKNGAVAGDVTSFMGTLPLYVDPVTPPFLRAGDALALPVQVVNTTGQPVSTRLDVSATGVGYIEASPGSVQVAAMSNTVRTVTLNTERSGTITVRAGLGEDDAVEQAIEVYPTGRPLRDERGGSLAAPRTFQLSGPPNAEPGSTRARLVIYPGALAVLKSELSRVEARSGVANNAYALLLSGQAPGLLARLSGEIDEGALRELQLISTQRVLRATRVVDTATATLLAAAALSNPDAPVLQRLGTRMVDQLISSQRPDGSFSDSDGWTVQRLLVATADASAALTQSLPMVTDNNRKRSIRRALLLASSTCERMASMSDDPYTAAALLVGGNVSDELAETLRARVRDAIVEEDGVRVLPVPEGVTRADGQRPSSVEATALAVLALDGDPEADGMRADMGAALLAAYSPGRGWGDGQASLISLRAVLSLFSEPLPEVLRITLKRDGTVLSEGEYNRTSLREVLVLDAIGLDGAGMHRFEVSAEPAVPGLGFSLALESWVPWGEPADDQGLEANMVLPEQIRVGQPATIALQAAAPSQTPFTIEQHLPAGVQPDEDSLQALVDSNALRGFETEDGLIRMAVTALEPGEALSIQYDVIPTLGGSLQSGPLSVFPDTQPALTVHYPPEVWAIR